MPRIRIQAMMLSMLAPDITEPALAKEPMLRTLAKEPMDPMLRAEPTEPMLSTEFFEPIDSTESCEAMLHLLVINPNLISKDQ